MKKQELVSFADIAANNRKVKSIFLNQIEILIDCRPITTLINRVYKRGANAAGRPSGQDPFISCRHNQIWYFLSGYEIEGQVNIPHLF